jgi:hypothetical protein
MQSFTQVTGLVLLTVITKENLLLNELMIYDDHNRCNTKL